MAITRFAPSPTGYLHVGGARTALFALLWARKTGGRFILRIEDTDQKRNTPTAMQQVIDDLGWLGIDWDEGPGIEGVNGPYLQSQRRDIYDKYLQKLLGEKSAYYCFETAEELATMRAEAATKKESFLYRRPEKLPDESDVEKARAEGKPVVVRFAMPNTEIIVKDIIRGEVKFGANEIGDFIIRKSDGFPTYHFACVVDDELMAVTHVLRGQEHLMNTPGHQALQDALGFRRPAYAHMSVTVSEGGGKLSKRDRAKTLRKEIKARSEIDLEKLASVGNISGDEMNSFLKKKTTPDNPAVDAMAKAIGIALPEINIVDFSKSGYLPEALVNFIALLGWNPGGDREIMTFDELVEVFDENRFTKANSLFDRKKLLAFNTEHMKILSADKLLDRLKSYLTINNSPVAAGSDELLMRLIKANEGARTLADIDKKSRFLFVDNDRIEYDEKAVKKVLLKNDGQGLAMLAELKEKLGALKEVTAESVENMLRSLADEKQLGLGKVAQPLRVAICGTTISPPIFDSVDLLGLENTIARIDETIRKFSD